MGLNNAFADMFGASQRSDAFAPSYMPDFISNFLRSDAGSKLRTSGSNYKAALKLSAVYNAVDQISNSDGIIPYSVFQETNEGRIKLKDHPVHLLLSSEPDGPSGWLTPFIFKKQRSMSILLRGNALYKIITQNDGLQILKYIPWDDVQDIKIVKGTLVYIIKGGETLLSSEVLHYRNFSLDGIVGIGAITYGAMQMNLAIELQNFSYSNLENKGIRNGVIETEKVLGNDKIPAADVKKKIKQGWADAMQVKSPDRIVVLDDGFKFKPITITPQEAQILEMSKFTIDDIARWFNIAPHKLKSMTASTNNNIEQQTIDYSTDTMQPYVTNFEQEDSKKLISLSEKKQGVYIKGNMNVLLRADIKSRGEFYSKMAQGIYTANEIRELEDKNKLPGGDELRFPINLQTQSQIDQNKENE